MIPRLPCVASVLLAIGMLAFPPRPVHAQAAEAAAPVLVVLDALTLAPVPGAEVVVAALGAFRTDGDGRLRLPSGTAGEIAAEVFSLGYVPRVAILALSRGQTVTVTLEPDPQLLDGIEVVLDRLAYRRARTFTPVRVMDARELAGVTPSGLEATVRVMAGGIGPCATAAGGCDGDPAVVLLDDWRFPYRLGELSAFDPTDLYAVEVYPRRSLVRVYTRDFVERAAVNPRLVALHGAGLPTRPVTAQREPVFAATLREQLGGF
jgi:hypothetical protein